MPKFKGVIHVHSKGFSKDAKYSLQEIKDFCVKNNFNFVCITEHSDHLNKKKLKILISTCKKLSDKDFLFIPGMELTTPDKFHVLGLGLKKYYQGKTVRNIIDFINKNNSVSVFSHPNKYKNIPYDKLADVNGIEVWNFEYDGFLPRNSNIDLLNGVRWHNENIYGFFGLDFHHFIHKRFMYIEVNVLKLTEKNILLALKNGDFRMKSRFFTFTPFCQTNYFYKVIFAINSLAFDVLKPFGIFVFSVFRRLKDT